jgi:hypothetical protein
MNSKPKSWAALKKSVQAADIRAMPSSKLGAKRADKLILNCLAEAGSDMGAGARPGNASIERASGLRWSQCHAHIVGLKKAGMIERHEAVGGRGMGSVYRIVWSHPAFPDHSPNGRECFIEKPSGLREKNHPVSSEKPSGLESETIRVRNQNHPGSDVKPSGVRPEHIPIPSQEHPNPNPTNETAKAGWQGFVENLPSVLSREIQLLSKNEIETYKTLVGEQGSQLMAATASLWITPGVRPLPVEGLNKQLKIRVFFREFRDYLEQAKQSSPEGRAAAQRREDEKVEAAEAFARQCHKQEFVTPEDEEAEEAAILESQRMFREAK